LYADRQRNLGAFDPYLRELHFSLGCALENLLITAHARGHDATLTLVPGKLDRIPSQPEPMLVAAVNLAPGKPREDELYNAIPHRHTNRDPSLPGKALDIKFPADLRRLREDDVKLFIFTAEHNRRELVKLIVDRASLMTDANVQSGTRPWLRMTMEEWQRSRDGVYMGPSSSFKPRSLDEYATLMMSGPLFGVIAVRDRYDRRLTIRAGRLWQRAHLLATARKIAARPANGAVEMIDHERALMQEPTTVRRIAKITGDENWQPTFMFYMGYPTVQAEASAPRSPREVLL
jgi:hypothetical protein